MKPLHLWGILLFTLCLAHHSYAKKPSLTSELTCEQKTAIVLPYVDDFKDYPKPVVNEMIAYLAPCVAAEDITAIYITGVLTLYKDNSPFSHPRERESMDLLTKATDANYKPAILHFAILKLTGEYKKITSDTYATPRLLFRKMLDLNYKTDIANYGLGYIELKGLLHRNRIGQYYVARRFFNASNHPMAKHWLAIMDYNGYGIINNEPNKEKALQSLQENNILNSKVFLESLSTQNNDWIPISYDEDKLLRQGAFAAIDVNKLKNKTFQGKFVEYDWEWRKKEVRRYLPFTIKFTDNNSSQRVSYELKINGKTYTGTGSLKPSWIDFSSLTLPLKVIYPDHPDKKEIKYSLRKLLFRESAIGGNPVWLVKPFRGFAFVQDESWEEEIHNIGMLLYEEVTTPTASIARQQNISGTKKEDADFAVISPNPINEQFTITYNFNEPTTIKVSIFDLYGNKKIDLPIERSGGIGHKTLPIDSSSLSTGIYLVQMTVNGVVYSKTISKN